jgi:hypothetical protein
MSEPINSWRQLLDRYEEFKAGQWCFRGDNSKTGGLKTSLERAAVDRWGRDWSELPEIEEGLIRRFRREAHLFLPSEPVEGDRIGWLSLMRHHGAPTRLLDWSFSFFVAVHFAVERAEADRPSSLFAMNLERIRDRVDRFEHLKPLLRKDPNAKAEHTVKAIIDHSPRKPLIFPLNPWRMNRRLILQQSIFLVPGDITMSFMDNLRAVGRPEDLLMEIPLSNDRRFLQEATRELLSMNMSSATLFPGLDGFAQNLTSLIPFPYLRAVDSELGLE